MTKNLDTQLHEAITAALAEGYSAEHIADTFTASLNKIEQEQAKKSSIDITDAVQAINEGNYNYNHLADLFMHKLREELSNPYYDDVFAEYTANREDTTILKN